MMDVLNASLNNSQKLYEKLLNFNLRDTSSSSLRSSLRLCLSVEWQSPASVVHNKELLINLTDLMDPFFLFTLSLSRDDFLNLKQQQGLLVDFIAFPQSFINLLEQCLSEENKADPKHLLYLNMGKIGSNPGVAQLDIVETNQFRLLTHLSLKLNTPTDLMLKQYLTTCFKKLKDEKEMLEKRTCLLDMELKKQVDRLKEIVNEKNRICEAQQTEQEATVASVKRQYEEKLKLLKDKALDTLNIERRRWKEEMTEKDYNHGRALKNNEAKVTQLEQTNKEMKEKIEKLEQTEKRLNISLKTLDKEVRGLRSQLHTYTAEKGELETELKGTKPELESLKTSRATMEKQIAAQEKVILELQAELQDVTENNVTLESDFRKMKQELEKDCRKEKKLNDNIVQAHHIIRKMQDEIRRFKEEESEQNNKIYKLNGIVKKQKARIQSCEEEKEFLHKNLTEAKQPLLQKVDILERKLVEAEAELQSKQKIINFFKEQVHSPQEVKNTAANNSDSTFPKIVSDANDDFSNKSPAYNQEQGGLFHKLPPSTESGLSPNSETNWNFQLDPRYLEVHPRAMMHQDTENDEEGSVDGFDNDNLFDHPVVTDVRNRTTVSRSRSKPNRGQSRHKI